MTTATAKTPAMEVPPASGTALEHDFPIVEVSQLAEQESWRKELNRPVYHIHKWWATRLGSVFRAIVLAALFPRHAAVWKSFYSQHSLSGKVVLDPFMGSGTTLGEALKLGAKAIGSDINPVSTFMVHQAFASVQEADLRAAFRQLELEVAPEIRHYYQTRDPLSGKLIPVLYFFWVKVLTTPQGETVPLFDRYVFAHDAYPKRKPRAQIVCPGCWDVIVGRHDATDVECSRCHHRFNPQIGPASGQHVTTQSGARFRIQDLLPSDGSPPGHRLYALVAQREDGEKIYLAARSEDLGLYREAETRLATESLPLPTLQVRSGYNTDQARSYNYLRWRDFFNARQLLCLGLLLRAILRIESQSVQEQLICLFSSTLEFNNLFCSFKGEGTGAVRHMFSNHILKPERTPLENSIWGTEKGSGTFPSLFERRLLRAKRYLEDPFELIIDRDLFGNRIGVRKVSASSPLDVFQYSTWEKLDAAEHGALILNGDSARLPLPDSSVDAVVTDPPYFDFVHYSELSDFFFAWLAPALRQRYPMFVREDSSDPGEVQHRDPRTFACQLTRVFTECRRVLKEEGVLAFSFHHSRPEGWSAIYEAVTKAGLTFVAAHPVHAELRAASPKAAAKDPISLDAILVCRKQLDASGPQEDRSETIARTLTLARRLSKGGIPLSKADHFVIGASQLLISSASANLSFDAMTRSLEELRKDIAERLDHGGRGDVSSG